MGQYPVLNEEQEQLVKNTGMDPVQFVVILDNDRCLCLLHLKTRNEVSIFKNEVRTHGSQ